jgi:anthranilate phosphoribosyltransferase
VAVADVLAALDIAPRAQVGAVASSEVAYMPTALLCPSLQRLLQVRQAIGVRNSSHSLVKLMNPCEGRAVIVGSYTHPEYAVAMTAVYELMKSTAMLLRGTEGEPVADPRRLRRIEGFVRGERITLEPGEEGPLTELPDLPDLSAPATAAYTRDVLAGKRLVPAPIARQVEHILRLVRS